MMREAPRFTKLDSMAADGAFCPLVLRVVPEPEMQSLTQESGRSVLLSGDSTRTERILADADERPDPVAEVAAVMERVSACVSTVNSIVDSVSQMVQVVPAEEGSKVEDSTPPASPGEGVAVANSALEVKLAEESQKKRINEEPLDEAQVPSTPCEQQDVHSAEIPTEPMEPDQPQQPAIKVEDTNAMESCPSGTVEEEQLKKTPEESKILEVSFEEMPIKIEPNPDYQETSPGEPTTPEVGFEEIPIKIIPEVGFEEIPIKIEPTSVYQETTDAPTTPEVGFEEMPIKFERSSDNGEANNENNSRSDYLKGFAMSVSQTVQIKVEGHGGHLELEPEDFVDPGTQVTQDMLGSRTQENDTPVDMGRKVDEAIAALLLNENETQPDLNNNNNNNCEENQQLNPVLESVCTFQKVGSVNLEMTDASAGNSQVEYHEIGVGLSQPGTFLMISVGVGDSQPTELVDTAAGNSQPISWDDATTMTSQENVVPEPVRPSSNSNNNNNNNNIRLNIYSSVNPSSSSHSEIISVDGNPTKRRKVLGDLTNDSYAQQQQPPKTNVRLRVGLSRNSRVPSLHSRPFVSKTK